jgi:hypothetical protein
VPHEMTNSALVVGSTSHDFVGNVNALSKTTFESLGPRGPLKLFSKLFDRVDAGVAKSAERAHNSTSTFWIPFSEGVEKTGSAFSNPFAAFYGKHAGFTLPDDAEAAQKMLQDIKHPDPYVRWPTAEATPEPEPTPTPAPDPAPTPVPPGDGGDTTAPAPTEPPKDGGETPPTDGGTPPTDGGTPPTDGGTPPTDGGETPPSDGGTTPPTDGGETPPTDGGTPPTDGGTTPPTDGAPADPTGPAPSGGGSDAPQEITVPTETAPSSAPTDAAAGATAVVAPAE